MTLSRTYTVDYTATGDYAGVDSTSTGGVKKIDADLTLAYAHLTSLQKNYTSASAPSGSVVGQIYHDTDVDRWLGKNNAGNFVNIGELMWSIITTATNAIIQNGYMCNTSAAAFTLTLPAAPAVGDVIGVCDGASTFDTNNLTIGRNALKIMGLAEDMIVSTKNVAFQLVYESTALGWRIA